MRLNEDGRVQRIIMGKLVIGRSIFNPRLAHSKYKGTPASTATPTAIRLLLIKFETSTRSIARTVIQVHIV